MSSLEWAWKSGLLIVRPCKKMEYFAIDGICHPFAFKCGISSKLTWESMALIWESMVFELLADYIKCSTCAAVRYRKFTVVMLQNVFEKLKKRDVPQ